MKALSKFLGLLCIGVCFNQAVLANPIHTWHTVTSAKGSWQGRLSSINQHAMFVTKNGAAINQFNVTQNTPFIYGFGFRKNDDFDVAYTVTLTEKSGSPLFSSKACVFVVTANSPANPDIRSLSYHGAKCAVVPGSHGADFLIG